MSPTLANADRRIVALLPEIATTLAATFSTYTRNLPPEVECRDSRLRVAGPSEELKTRAASAET